MFPMHHKTLLFVTEQGMMMRRRMNNWEMNLHDKEAVMQNNEKDGETCADIVNQMSVTVMVKITVAMIVI